MEDLKEGGRYYPEYVEIYESDPKFFEGEIKGMYHLLTESKEADIIVRVSNWLEKDETVEELKARSMEMFKGLVKEKIG